MGIVRRIGRGIGWAAVVAGVGLAGRRLLARPRRLADLSDQVVLITGGSRGLGFLLAREFAREGCRVAICARNELELQRAKVELEGNGVEVLTIPCDVADRAQAERMVDEVSRHWGGVDILVNNAGIIQVGPVQTMAVTDFEQAMGVMYWGVLYPTLAVLDQMRERKSGRIVNITSIGGKISIPHLLPYNSAKFAAMGLSEGLRAELARDGVTVTTIVPGLMRTGSHINAYFKGRQDREYTWFALGASLPVISMDAERAARQIVDSVKRGDAERILSLPATALSLFHGVFPGTTANILGVVNRILPRGNGAAAEMSLGMEVQDRMHSTVLMVLTGWGLSAAKRFQR
jgi:NAD(P)-dependent dehydrogenase (short-subunit alcohol dehydrogenase family)